MIHRDPKGWTKTGIVPDTVVLESELASSSKVFCLHCGKHYNKANTGLCHQCLATRCLDCLTHIKGQNVCELADCKTKARNAK